MEFVNRPVPQRATLDAIIGGQLDNGHASCFDYPPDGLRLLGDRDISMEEYMRDLCEAYPGHGYVGMCSLGVMGKSYDVSRYSILSSRQGEPPLAPGLEGSFPDLRTQHNLPTRADGSGCSFKQ